MSKRTLQGRTQLKGGVGKTYGRSYGPMVYNETVDNLVTQKIDKAIKRNKQNK
tara:strand:+ start:319 stop:477 length:159 start_codon:yes stop_codon:yes gene_type:complete